MNKPLKICLVSPLPLPKGGISHWTELVTNYSKDNNVNIINVDTAVRWRSVADLRLWKRVLGGGSQLIRDIINCTLTLIKHRPDVLHLTTAGHLGLIRDVAVLAISRIFNCPSVYHIRFGRLPKISQQKTVEWKVFKVALMLANKTIVIDSQTETTLAKHTKKCKLLNIPNCFDPSVFPQKEATNSNVLNVCFVGWVIPTKGIKELLNTWDEIALENAVLHVIGPYDEAYKKELQSVFKLKGVNFHGALSHSKAMKIMSESNIFVLPSHTEGFPNVVLEAMALGKAIIATDVGAIPDMLAGDCGLLFSPKDQLKLSEKLSSLAVNEKLRLKLGENAKIKAYQKYSIEIIFNQYIKVWNSCI